MANTFVNAGVAVGNTRTTVYGPVAVSTQAVDIGFLPQVRSWSRSVKRLIVDSSSNKHAKAVEDRICGTKKI